MTLPILEASKFKSMEPMSRFMISADMQMDELVIDREASRVEALNPKQRVIYDYVMEHPNSMVLIQAGPGTGKTFTLKAIAHTPNIVSSVVIFKHDLLAKFRYCSALYTVASLFMKMFSMNYMAYKAFSNQICSNMSPQEFIYCMLTLLNTSILPPFYGGIVLLDEYTVMEKPLLLVLLMLLRRYKIRTVISGDCHQLQSIQGQNDGITSFEIAQMFSDATFSLDVNQRCPDPKYNVVIKYISKFSSSMDIEGGGYAMMAAVFLNKLAATSAYTDLHLAGTHRELTRLIHMYVTNEQIPVEFYEIQQSSHRRRRRDGTFEDSGEEDTTDGVKVLENGMIQPSIVTQYVFDKAPKKFLPYLPLYVGGQYYVMTRSDKSIATLVQYDQQEQMVTMRFEDGHEEVLGKGKCGAVIPEPHHEAIMQTLKGHVHNYPIYPANIMTMHRCQGCTISSPLDINLANTTYQGMYVAISRVTNPDGIRRITMPDMLSYLLSTIINFPEHATPDFYDFTEEMLDARMTNYQFYQISEPKRFVNLLSAFCNSRDSNERIDIRQQLIELSKSCMRKLLNLPKPPNRQEFLAINQFVKDYETFMSAALIKNDIDRAIWLHEYMRTNIDYSMLLQNHTCYRSNSLKLYCNPDLTYPFSTSTVDYILSHSVLEDEFTALQNSNRLVREDSFYYRVSETRFQKMMYDKYMEDPSGGFVTTEFLRSMLPKDPGYEVSETRKRTHRKAHLVKRPRKL